MGGEIGIKIKELKLDKDVVYPYSNQNPNNFLLDFSMLGDDGNWLHICGNNDWGYLLVEALMPLFLSGLKLYEEIKQKIQNDKPEVILVGKNEFRLLDILHKVRSGGDGIEVILSVPIVKGNFVSGIKYYGRKDEIPFY